MTEVPELETVEAVEPRTVAPGVSVGRVILKPPQSPSLLWTASVGFG